MTATLTTPTPVSATVKMLTCPDCGETMDKDYFVKVVREGEEVMVCDGCCNDDYTRCERCDHMVHNSEIERKLDGGIDIHYFCESCNYELEMNCPENLYAIEMERRMDEWRLEHRCF